MGVSSPERVRRLERAFFDDRGTESCSFPRCVRHVVRPTVRLRRRSEVLLDVCPLTFDVIQATAHVERLLRDVIILTVRDLGEALDRVGQRDGRTVKASELLGNVGVLGQEALDTTSPVYQDLV